MSSQAESKPDCGQGQQGQGQGYIGLVLGTQDYVQVKYIIAKLASYETAQDRQLFRDKKKSISVQVRKFCPRTSRILSRGFIFLENTPIYVLIGNFGFLLPRIIGKEMVSQDKVGAIKSHPRDKHLHNNSVGRCGACVRLLSALCSVRFRCTLCIRPSVPHAVCQLLFHNNQPLTRSGVAVRRQYISCHLLTWKNTLWASVYIGCTDKNPEEKLLYFNNGSTY